MTKRTTILLWIVCLLSVGLASGAVYTFRTIAMYSQVCDDDLHGFPGLLQTVGFVPHGKCKALPTGACRLPQACEVNGKEGHCVTEIIRNRKVCICVPNKHSRP